MSRKAIKGVLHNFLETYTSRYSDYDGYWLFGLLVGELDQFNVNLLDAGEDVYERTPTTVAVRLAATKFQEQMAKVSIGLSCIREASLTVTKSDDLGSGFVNGHRSAGFKVSFVAKAVSSHGKTYERQKTVFVAPHDPNLESRSGRPLTRCKSQSSFLLSIRLIARRLFRR
ncbi:MAG: hypothetical protein ND895_04930 [Pyrinomonadaceae bacterium]|nr:hypothetical protein [Pyrinomonadaceae bacterium]